MGGMCTVVLRDREKKVSTFKVHTNFIETHIDNLKMLNEEYMLDFLTNKPQYQESATLDQHLDYRDSHALLASYYYGVILIDHFTKNVLSAQNFCWFAEMQSSDLVQEYQNLPMLDLTLQEIINKLETKQSQNFCHLYNIYQGLKIGANIMLRGIKYNIEGDTIFSFMARLVGQDLMTVEKDTIKDYVKQYYKTLSPEESRWGKNNMVIEVPNWTIYSGDGQATSIQKVFDFVQNNDFPLTQVEIDLWNKEIKNNPDL